MRRFLRSRVTQQSFRRISCMPIFVSLQLASCSVSRVCHVCVILIVFSVKFDSSDVLHHARDRRFSYWRRASRTLAVDKQWRLLDRGVFDQIGQSSTFVKTDAVVQALFDCGSMWIWHTVFEDAGCWRHSFGCGIWLQCRSWVNYHFAGRRRRVHVLSDVEVLLVAANWLVVLLVIQSLDVNAAGLIITLSAGVLVSTQYLDRICTSCVLSVSFHQIHRWGTSQDLESVSTVSASDTDVWWQEAAVHRAVYSRGLDALLQQIR